MMDVLRLIGMVVLAGLFVILVYALAESAREVDKSMKGLNKEKVKQSSEDVTVESLRFQRGISRACQNPGMLG